MSVLMQGRDINLDIKRVVAYRHWCNKLWNAIKFAMMNLGEQFKPSSHPQQLTFACRWIISRLNNAISRVVSALEAYDFANATQVSLCWLTPLLKASLS